MINFDSVLSINCPNYQYFLSISKNDKRLRKFLKMEDPQTIEQQPLLAQPPQSPHSTDDLIAVRFCVFKEAACDCPCRLCSCCKNYVYRATQIVVPNTTTVGEFIQILNGMHHPEKEYTACSIAGFRLRNDDLLAPTIKSFEKFESPLVVVPEGSSCCSSCLLI